MSWQPNKKQIELMETVIGMTTDCILGNGTDNEETYLSNLEILGRLIKKEGTE